MDTSSFIRQQFAEFYKEKATSIKAPSSIRQREFGFLIFKENVMVRHKNFTTVEALRSFIKRTVPAHAYYSTAYYELPKEKMEEKGWSGADLYFDIDADHIPTKCGKIHNMWICKKCGFKGKGVAPQKCPACDSKGFTEKNWPCDICLQSTKLEMTKLLDLLTKDFGFSKEELDVSFSGHRGYHVHVENETIRGLDSVARREIVDYITGVGLDPKFHGLEVSTTTRSPELPNSDIDNTGWRGRIAKSAYEMLSVATEEDLRSLDLREKTINQIVSNKDAILRRWMKSGPWRRIRGVGKEELERIINWTVKNQTVRIDTVVTTDIHRLIRLPNSIHGKTGWLKVSFPMDDIEKFDPLKHAIAFKKGEATIYVEEAPQFRLGEERYGPFKKQKVVLPMATALFLLCKGAARVVD